MKRKNTSEKNICNVIARKVSQLHQEIPACAPTDADAEMEDVKIDASGRSGTGRCECEGHRFDAALEELVS